jgi:hypothetical protein
MEQFRSIIAMLHKLVQYAGRLLHNGDYLSLSMLKKDLQKFCEKYQE